MADQSRSDDYDFKPPFMGLFHTRVTTRAAAIALITSILALAFLFSTWALDGPYWQLLGVLAVVGVVVNNLIICVRLSLKSNDRYYDHD